MKTINRANRTVEFRALIAAAALLSAGCWLHAQAPATPPLDQKQTKQTDKQKPASQAPANANPFPEDTNAVPVMPNGNETPAPAPNSAAPEPAPALPGGDVDPVRSPDEPPPDTSSSSSSGSASGVSSSSADLARILEPPSGDETQNSRKGKNLPEPEHKETAKDDESVGSYYLEQKNWKAALSRYESALVLDPENPDVYWGLAESQRHLGDVANAKSNYLKVMEYDPDSKHAKDAKKLLKEPEMANAGKPANPQ